MSEATKDDIASGSNETPPRFDSANVRWDSSRLRTRRGVRLSALIARKWCGVSEELSSNDDENPLSKEISEDSEKSSESSVGFKMVLRRRKRTLKREGVNSRKPEKPTKLPRISINGKESLISQTIKKSAKLFAKADSKNNKLDSLSTSDCSDTQSRATRKRGRPDCSDTRSRATRKRGRPKKKRIEVSSETEDSLPEREEKSPSKTIELDYIQKLEGEEKYQCTICTKKFRNESTSENHEICKVNEKSYACEYCHQKPLRKVEYEQHLKNHTGKDHFICHICSDWFLKRSKWRFHVLLHEGRSHFFCKPCQQKFPYSKRRIHVRSHAGEHQFSCQRCKEDFIVNIIENDSSEQETDQPTGICTYCGKKFATKFQYYTHFLTEAKCNYNCDQCTSLRVQKMAPFKCRKCKAKFTKRRNLENHRKSVHPPVKMKGLGKKDPVNSKGENKNENELDTAIKQAKTDQTSNPVEENCNLEDCGTPPLKELKEPCDPVSTIKIQLDQFTVLEFERVAPTKNKWQQTNPNNTEFLQDHDFCSQCQTAFDASSFHVVNTNCGHLVCKKCFETDAAGCQLCDDVDLADGSLQFLTNNEEDMLTRVKDIVKQMVSVRFKTDADEMEKTFVARSEIKESGEPVVLSCVRGPLEKAMSTKYVQFP